MDATILDPIPGDNPSGANLRYEVVYSEIRSLVRNARERAKPGAEWGVAISTCIYILKRRSKDLMIAAWLTEAWLGRDGLSGLLKGLEVSGGLLERFWETLYPEVEEGDIEARRRILEWLNTQLAPAVKLDEAGRRSKAAEETDEETTEAAMPARIAAYRRRVRDLAECRDSLQALDDAWREKSGESINLFPDLRKAMLEAMRETFLDLTWQVKKRWPRIAAELSGEFREWLSKERIEAILQRLDTPERAFAAESLSEPEERLHASSPEPVSSWESASEKPASEEPQIRDFDEGPPPAPSAPAPAASSGPLTSIWKKARVRDLDEGAGMRRPPVSAPSRVMDVSGGKGARITDDPMPPRATAPVPAPVVRAETQTVDFMLTAPLAVAPGVPFEMFVWAHEPQERANVLARAREELHVRDLLTRSKGSFQVASGTVLSVRLVIPGASIDEAEDSMVWEGESTYASFVVTLPEASAETKWAGSAQIYAGGVRVARISFVLTASGAEEISSMRYRKAFASYASDDRDAVLGRIQGIHKVAPEMEIFLDVLSLRSGQNWEQELWRVIPASDIFYLFWSSHARTSEWVEKEWRCALRERGIEFIDPIPLESPRESPPPPELRALHFNDWELAFRRGRR